MSIPKTVLASAAVAHGEHYAGELALPSLPRLKEVVAGAEAPLRVNLAVGRDAAGHAHLNGQIEGLLRLVCQRCLQTYTWPLSVRIGLRLVASEAEESRALHECEPYRVRDDGLPVHELVEDEVLLALPVLPRCESCENIVLSAPRAQAATDEGSGRNPFSELKNLKF